MPLPGASRNQTPLQRSVIYNGLRDGHGQWLIVNFAAANADKTIAHGLGRTPVGYDQKRIPSGGGLVTDGANNGTDWTDAVIVLQATATGTYTIFVQ
jgi:hypothetical protein